MARGKRRESRSLTTLSGRRAAGGVLATFAIGVAAMAAIGLLREVIDHSAG